MSTQEIPAKKTKFAANKTKTETAEAAQTENRNQMRMMIPIHTCRSDTTRPLKSKEKEWGKKSNRNSK